MSFLNDVFAETQHKSSYRANTSVDIAAHTEKVQQKLFLCFSYPSALDSTFNCS